MILSSLNTALSFEKAGEMKKAAVLYETLSKKPLGKETALNRLLVIYRHLKKYSKELQTIGRLVSLHQMKYAARGHKGNKIRSLSKKINQSLGRIDKKGNPVYQPESIQLLLKRKLRVCQKINAMA